MEPQR